ncbi:DUF2568 domain-containing protein [Paenibacillus lautus]|uniref:DUF2568 domain-containing protein n=1 Tax=Paenibacillus lautus TaxID=1401 RepID=UPI00384EB23D
MFKVLNLALRFMLELILLFSIGYWGFHYGTGLLAQAVLGSDCRCWQPSFGA